MEILPWLISFSGNFPWDFSAAKILRVVFVLVWALSYIVRGEKEPLYFMDHTSQDMGLGGVGDWTQQVAGLITSNNEQQQVVVSDINVRQQNSSHNDCILYVLIALLFICLSSLHLVHRTLVCVIIV